jgi:hypothetical protein
MNPNNKFFNVSYCVVAVHKSSFEPTAPDKGGVNPQGVGSRPISNVVRDTTVQNTHVLSQVVQPGIYEMMTLGDYFSVGQKERLTKLKNAVQATRMLRVKLLLRLRRKLKIRRGLMCLDNRAFLLRLPKPVIRSWNEITTDNLSDWLEPETTRGDGNYLFRSLLSVLKRMMVQIINSDNH